MKILIIPDVHLKPWMFQRASALLKQNIAERAVCLMDIADDWKQQYNLDLYEETYDMAIWFAREYPQTLWCYGNHDVCYLWNQRESGYSKIAPATVCRKLQELKTSLPDERQLAYIHRIDNVLFMHGGLAEYFVLNFIPAQIRTDIDKVIEMVNGFGYSEMWNDMSPIWFRPQVKKDKLYKERQFLQVVGHTPVKEITREGNLISCDVFCTDMDRNPYGEAKFLILDTRTWEGNKISGNERCDRTGFGGKLEER